ncbi:hypothetical protein EVAR_49395_1 [Eumeta japonica]|uniref:Uncharacterized protein n=1 Tax=Eumeta variegata TaxID=151549 RepID=A0A4C1YLX5_EUMVA|nr:hypothetical protein EVAR_49395_1 [Eumeta japonica]
MPITHSQSGKMPAVVTRDEIENRRRSSTNINHHDTITHHKSPPQSPSEVVQPPAAPARRSSDTSKKSKHAGWLAKAREEVAKLKLEVAFEQLQCIEAEGIDKDSSSSSEIEAPAKQKKVESCLAASRRTDRNRSEVHRSPYHDVKAEHDADS